MQQYPVNNQTKLKKKWFKPIAKSFQADQIFWGHEDNLLKKLYFESIFNKINVICTNVYSMKVKLMVAVAHYSNLNILQKNFWCLCNFITNLFLVIILVCCA